MAGPTLHGFLHPFVSQNPQKQETLNRFYVREKRGNKQIVDFEKVKCWFVHNSNTPDNYGKSGTKEINNVTELQPEIIKSDEILNILWLSNPAISRELDKTDIGDIGLTSLVAFTLNQSIPKAAIIRELDDNIEKYSQNEISDKDIILISTRIVNRQLKDIQKLNELAINDKQSFVKRLREEADKQSIEEAEKQKKIDGLLEQLNSGVEQISLGVKSLEGSKEKLEQRKTYLEEQERLRTVITDNKINSYEVRIENLENERLKTVGRDLMMDLSSLTYGNSRRLLPLLW